VDNSKLDKIYTASGDAQMRDAYDDWADEYDADVTAQGYVTPKRVADALANFVNPAEQIVLDYGCGTGLSGVALKDAGFLHVDGTDLSQKMLDIAHRRAVYRKLHLVEPDETPDEALGLDLKTYPAICATGVISKGAAPPSLYQRLLSEMAPKARLAFSINDLSLADPDYAPLVKQSIDTGEAELLFEKHGPHLAQYENNAGSTVYVVEKVG